MDERARIAGVLAAIAMIGGIILAATSSNGVEALLGLAGTFGGYVVGLYSDPRSAASRLTDALGLPEPEKDDVIAGDVPMIDMLEQEDGQNEA